jgi:hypothetical protein
MTCTPVIPPYTDKASGNEGQETSWVIALLLIMVMAGPFSSFIINWSRIRAHPTEITVGFSNAR